MNYREDTFKTEINDLMNANGIKKFMLVYDTPDEGIIRVEKAGYSNQETVFNCESVKALVVNRNLNEIYGK